MPHFGTFGINTTGLLGAFSVADLDLLLRWLSVLGTGNWQTFKDGVAAVALDGQELRATSVAQTLSSLAHIEIDWTQRRWWVAPPLLVVLPNAGLTAVLAGRRTPELDARLQDLLESDIDVDIQQVRQVSAPQAIFISAARWDDLLSAAQALCVGFSGRFVQTVSSHLPLMEAPSPQVIDLPPDGQWFDPSDLMWTSGSMPPYGLRRYEEFGTPSIYWGNGEGWARVDLDIGRYLAVNQAGRDVLRFVSLGQRGDLESPASMPLPWIQRRLATMSSGLIATTRSGNQVFENVPSDVARAIAFSVGQHLP